ncbi:asparagine synthase (glutamine-hydrolyzing) [Cellulophaga sp. Hel_I_12]|uniref:asparagine synthase (glutamine-hydrolyzing) n=1 Tax=Cellulophaga sp. Hel_I_12 TaxID=1249972 RepID=UPI00068F88C1|nr:asparagine synthase (glutamine-hydrolyzing) [Cellulophaga sp. Hel_I_12]
MCGISGIILKDKSFVNKNDLIKMNNCIKHRGPDGEGFYYNGNLGFGHRRLSIIDLTDLGAQPMEYNEDYIMTYNGEVYNYLEIRGALQKLGYLFRSESDTEVILAAYKEWGEKCVDHFNGMWAFAIFDKKRNVVFCSRDRFGVKPFYYYNKNNAFYFGSEIKQLLTQINNPKVNKQILFDYLYLGYHHHSDDTFFEEVTSLTPGFNLTYELTDNTFKIERYYSLKINEEYAKLSFQQAELLFRETIDNSIKLRLRSDVKVGTCLSGGMDSSYIAATAAKAYKAEKKFTAITAKSIEKETDESYFAKKVVEHCNLDWKIVEPEINDFFKFVDEVIETQEEPFGSPSIIMQYFVMKKAKEEGCIVLLDGQGGDEALLGYDRYYSAYLNQKKGLFNKIKGALEISKKSKLSITEVLAYNFYFNNAKIRALRQLKRYGFVKKEYKKFMNNELLKKLSAVNKDIHQLQEFEITKVQLQKLLKYEDRNSMKFSIETRVPFVDYKVVELAFSLPFSYKMHEGWSKYILRKVAQEKLPDEIVWRKNKFGFESPNKKWLENKQSFIEKIKKSKFMNEFIETDKLPDTIDDISLWKLYNITLWSEKFNVVF